MQIANSLPPRVTSDPVINLRNKEFRRIDGSVTAVNPYAFSGAGGFRSGPLPYIKINGTAKSPQDAIDITNTTALAFKKWFEARQVQGGTKVADRVLVEQVNSANSAAAQGGSKPLLGVGAALLVLLGAAGFALALERLIPRRSPRAQRAAAVRRARSGGARRQGHRARASGARGADDDVRHAGRGSGERREEEARTAPAQALQQRLERLGRRRRPAAGAPPARLASHPPPTTPARPRP